MFISMIPLRELFAKTERAFSSGCIRLESPMELADYLLRDDPRGHDKRLSLAVKEGTEQVVQLPTSIPVHLLYWTAWTNEHGVVHFRKDIYGRDKVLEKAIIELYSVSKDERMVEAGVPR